jgi:hypothetical protein
MQAQPQAVQRSDLSYASVFLASALVLVLGMVDGFLPTGNNLKPDLIH